VIEELLAHGRVVLPENFEEEFVSIRGILLTPRLEAKCGSVELQGGVWIEHNKELANRLFRHNICRGIEEINETAYFAFDLLRLV